MNTSTPSIFAKSTLALVESIFDFWKTMKMAPESYIAADTAHFMSVPWCNDLISSPNLVLFTPTCRQPVSNAPAASRDVFFRKSLKNDDAIPYAVGLYEDPENPLGPGAASSKPQGAPALYVKSSTLLCELRPGLAGYSGFAHGGLISTLVDEAMGSLILINHLVQADIEKKGRKLPEGTLDLNNTRILTASMNVRFQKPLPVASIVAVTARFVRSEGRKLLFDVKVKGERGQVFAQCDGMWASMPLQKM